MLNNNALAILFALGSALTIAWGTVVRHRIALAAGENKSSAILDAIRVPLWWVGVFSALFGYFLQIVALSFGTLLIVQPILVLSLMFTLPLSARYEGRKIPLSETLWAGVLTLAVAVTVILGRPTPGQPEPDLPVWLMSLGIGVAIIGVVYLVALKQAPWLRALLLGCVTGAIMGFLAVLSKAVVNIFTLRGIIDVALSWELYGLIIAAAVGTAVQQASFNAGPLKNSLPAMTVVEPLVAFVLGYVILGEKFHVTGWEWSYLGIAILTMVFATVVLSRKSIE